MPHGAHRTGVTGQALAVLASCSWRWFVAPEPGVLGRLDMGACFVILMVRMKAGATDEQVESFMQAISALPFPGRHNVVVGRDIGSRPGNMDLAVSNDFPDELTFRAWGDDPEHAKVRDELLAPIAERIERCLFPGMSLIGVCGGHTLA